MSSDFARGFVASEFSRHELDLMLKLQTMREGGQDTRKEKMLLDLQQRRVAAQNRIRTMEQTRDVRIKKWLEQRQLEVEARRRRNERRHADAAERVAVRAGERAFKHLAESEAKQREKTEEELAAQLERVRQSVRNQADTMRRKAAARSRECDDRKWGWHCAGSPRATTPCSSALEGIAGASPGVLGTTGVRYDSEPSATQPASALAHPHPPAAGQSRPRSARGGASASTPEKAGGAAGGTGRVDARAETA